MVDSPNFMIKIKNKYLNYLIIKMINKINQKLYLIYDYNYDERLKINHLISKIEIVIQNHLKIFFIVSCI